MAKVVKLLAPTAVPEGRSGSDTLQLWESFRDQAILWRTLALLQIPVSALALITALVIYSSSSPIINVPERPLPGQYQSHQLPDPLFIEAATDFVNLIGTYTPAVARRQFAKAREMLTEPLLSKFDKEVIDIELKAIESTSRSQLFFVDPTKTTIQRGEDRVLVTLIGDRVKMVAGRPLDPQPTRFQVILTTVPKNIINPYGIMVSVYSADNVEVQR